MEEADVVGLRESILDLLMVHFARRLLDPDLLVEANALVRDKFLQLDRDGILPIMFGEGAVLTGYDVEIDHERSSLGLTPRTRFFPTHRYRPSRTGDDRSIPLGFCGRFDLWVERDQERPPTIIARYGDDADHYLSANPEILGLAIVRQIGDPFPEALRRLVVLGLLDDDGASDTEHPCADPFQASRRPDPLNWRRLFPWWPRRD
jgi:hypothetical protein